MQTLPNKRFGRHPTDDRGSEGAVLSSKGEDPLPNHLTARLALSRCRAQPPTEFDATPAMTAES